VSNPRDLLLQQLSQLLWVERMLAFEVLPKLVADVKSETLRALVEHHLVETREHASRVEQAFAIVGAETSSNRDAGFDALRKQHEEQVSNTVGDGFADLLHAGSAIRAEHAEIALYDALLRVVESLGFDDAHRLLGANRAEELRALELLDRETASLAAQLGG
jgi:ferritin-like metal-binding protein YciE